VTTIELADYVDNEVPALAEGISPRANGRMSRHLRSLEIKVTLFRLVLIKKSPILICGASAGQYAQTQLRRL
jgi:hypothetical protein